MKSFPLMVWVYAIVLAMVVSLPHLAALNATPEGGQYSGALAIPEGFRVDYNSHLAKMWQGSRGDFTYELLFTHEDHAELFTVQGFYVALGAIAELFNLNFALTYHLVRFILTITMVLALWRFASYYFGDANGRWLALIFGSLVTGVGWLLLLIAPLLTANVAPIEFWLIDAYNLIGAMYMPHFAAAITLQLIAFLIFEAWRTKPQPHHIPLLTVILLIDAIIQPYVVLVTFPLFGMLSAYFVFIEKSLPLKQALWLIVPAFAHGGIVIYQYFSIASDPIWATFATQNDTLSPHPLYYIMGYLLFLLPIALGIPRLVTATKADKRWLLPILWVIIVIVLLYAPIPTQRRYLLGVQSPLAILSVVGVLAILKNRVVRLALVPYVAVGSIAPMLLIFANVTTLSSVPRAMFYSADEVTVAEWIRENTATDTLILTTFEPSERGTGGAVVAMTGRRVFIGHWIETADFDMKQAQLHQFYDDTTEDSWRQDFLATIDADYIWYDAEAQTYGDFEPSTATYLDPVIEISDVTLYEVSHD